MQRTTESSSGKRNLFDELMDGVRAMRESRWSVYREGFNPPVGPMQPVSEGLHPMVALDDPILGSSKNDILT